MCVYIYKHFYTTKLYKDKQKLKQVLQLSWALEKWQMLSVNISPFLPSQSGTEKEQGPYT